METLLLVDDDPSVLLLLEALLKDEGYTILTASNGLDAQSVVENQGHKISAIVLDRTMPRMDGIELLRWIKDQPQFRYIPVIMHTVMTNAKHVREGIEAGAFYYLPKPARKEIIQSLVRAAVVDHQERILLLKKLREGENPFRLLEEGRFRFRTLTEGEYLAVRIANACPEPERASMVMEMITNAIEHGNLGITYADKTKFMEAGRWFAEIERRLTLPEHQGKFVDLHLKRYADKMTVLVEDQGPGFDFLRYMEIDESRLQDNHGRGIAMAKEYLELHYLGSGNKVLVTIPFHWS